MSTRAVWSTVAIVLPAALALAGCGSNSSSNSQPIRVTLAPSAAQTLSPGKTLTLTATVANDSSNRGVTWAVAGGGTLGQETASSAIYTAPATVTAALQATVTAAAAADPSATASVAITVNPNPAVTTTVLPEGTAGAAYSATLAASGGTGALTWSVSAGTLPAWATLDAASGVLSGTPTAAGASSFSVTATDAAGVASAPQALTLTVNAAGADDGALQGPYAFLLQDASSQTVLIGSLTADGAGGISGGEFDFRGTTVTAHGVNTISAGSYAVGADRRGTLSISDAAGDSFSFTLALGSLSGGVAGWGGITESDGARMLTGQILQQVAGPFTASLLSGDYAFALSGGGGTFAEAGRFTVSGAAISAGLADSNQSGTLTTASAFTGSIGNLDSNGRAQVTLTPSGGSSSTDILYVISAGRFFLSGTGGSADSVAGEGVQQTGGPYTAASLSGNAVIWTQGATGTPAARAEAGLLTFDGAGGATGVIDTNAGGVITAAQSLSGLTYAVTSAGGRFTLTTPGSSAQVGYLIGSNSAFALDSGSSPAVSRILPQAAGPFTTATLQGAFAVATVPLFAANTPPPAGVAPWTNETGVIAFDGAGGLSATLDAAQPGVAQSGVLQTDTYTVGGNGRVSTGSGNQVLYIVSPTRLILLLAEPNNPNPTVQDLRQ
jgi:hypothetical protein